MNEKTIINSTAAIGGTVLTCLIGGWDSALGVLAILIIVDYLTGLTKGFKSGTLSSSIGYNGLIKKIGIFVAIIVAHQLDMASGMNPPIFRTLAVYFYIGNEGLSVLENLAILGIPLPNALKEGFEKIEGANDGRKVG